MPRRPYRHAALENLPPRDPMRDVKAMLGMSRDELFFFASAAIDGLLDRLRRRNPRDADAAEYFIDFTLKRFGPFAKECGIEAAQRVTTLMVANRPLSTADQGPDPLELLREYVGLVDTVSRLSTYPKRWDWLVSVEKMSERKAEKICPHKGAEFAEDVLANRHNMSQSKIHKVLAKVHREARLLKSR